MSGTMIDTGLNFYAVPSPPVSPPTTIHPPSPIDDLKVKVMDQELLS